MAEIILNQVRKTYTIHRKKEKLDLEVHALNGLDLQVHDGEFMVLTGPSGGGKTTVLRVVAGFENYEGQVLINDEPMEDVPPNERDISMVFQNYALYPNNTAFLNMAFGLEVRRVDRDEIKRRVYEVADILDIRFLLNRRPKNMSLGQRQRVAIGRAVIREPDVLLMDEPLSNLDARARVDLLNKIEALHQKYHRTCMYVTHDQTEAMRIADRIAIINKGRVEQVAPPKEIYDYPANTFVATFMGMPPMSLLPGRLVRKEGRLAIQYGEQQYLYPDEATAAACSEYENREILFGFRPEDMKEVYAVEENVMFPTLKFMNMIGNDVYMYTCINEISDQEIIVHTDEVFSPRSNEKIMILPNMSKIHIFDRETQLRLNGPRKKPAEDADGR